MLNLTLTPNQIKALDKLVSTLNTNSVPFAVIGGLAAVAWGVERPLADIDIQVSKADLVRVRDLFKEYLETDIRHYQTARWDIMQMIINLDGTGVDVCQAEDFKVVVDGQAHQLPNTLGRAVMREVGGLSIPVMPLNDLVAYKHLIARPVDLEDLAQLEDPTSTVTMGHHAEK